MQSLGFTIKARVKRIIKRFPYFDRMFSLLSDEDLNSYPANLKDQPIAPCPVADVLPVTFPPHYWEAGPHMLEYGHPWLTPGAVLYLANHLQRSFTALEIGSGGSTVFFASRCSSLVSVESNSDWQKSVTAGLAKRGLNNVQMFLRTDQKAMEDLVRERQDEEFDCILVDPLGGFDRSRLASLCQPKLKPHGLLILDNFAVVETDVHLGMKRSGWHSYYYVDPHWSGRGTSIHIKPPRR